MRVIKLGGSLADWPDLTECLAGLAACHCVIVPGGGPFADQVRRTQAAWRFDDRTAHDMAVLAMAQFGRMLAGLEPRLATARAIPALKGAIAAERSVVWLPDPADPDLQAVAASWDITSDSLAAWLAHRLDASELVLVKSAAVPAGEFDCDGLAASGLLDPAFAQHAVPAGFGCWLCHRADHRLLATELREAPGLRRLRWRTGG